MSGLANLDERIAKLEAAAERITERTREANSAIKELRQLKRDIEQLLGNDARALVDRAIGDQVSEGLTVMADEIVVAREKAVAAITGEFNTLAEIYTSSAEKDVEHIAVEAHRARDRRRETLAELRLPYDASGKKPTTKETTT